ncbi:MAG TPA: DUF502 domain-containing protein [Syntrophomonas sp.]|nr:DUF502 domain-containing protein [Syntrophomonas sp.]
MANILFYYFIFTNRCIHKSAAIQRLILLYGSVKDLLNAFVGDKKSFNKPVLVKLSNESHAHVMGFITCESLNSFGLDDYMSVYVPQSYNFAGQLLIFPRGHVQPLESNSADMMAFIVSGGVARS